MSRTYIAESYRVDATGVHANTEQISRIPISVLGQTDVNGETGLGVLWMPRKGLECRSVIPLSYFDFYSGNPDAIAEWVRKNIAAQGLKVDAVVRYIALCFEQAESAQQEN